MTFQKQHISLKAIEAEYDKNEFEDDDYMYRLKEVIDGLDPVDKALLIMYSDDGSMAKTGKKFNVSPATVYSNIKRIREEIKQKMNS